MEPVNYDELTQSERRYVRIRYVKDQDGLCCYCSTPLTGQPSDEVSAKPVGVKAKFPPNFFDWPIHLHHDKETGLTIGAVHCYCNAVSFEYEELPARMKKEGLV